MSSLSFNERLKIISAISILTWASLLVVVYIGYRSYKKIIADQRNQLVLLENQVRDRLKAEQDAQSKMSAQDQALLDAKNELENTKNAAIQTTSQLSGQLKTLKQELVAQGTKQGDLVINTEDISKYLTGVVQVICDNGTNELVSGSGSLWSFKEIKNAVLTNYHVVKGATKCVISITDASNQKTGVFALEGAVYTFNKDADSAILAISTTSLSDKNAKIANYNFSLPALRKCPVNTSIGSPVVIIGFPMYAKRDSIVNIESIGNVNAVYRTATNGIISGYDTSMKQNSALNKENFFISAKIDSGNSGGIALSKDDKGMCVLGLPTWLSVGNYENQGLIQNISNIIP